MQAVKTTPHIQLRKRSHFGTGNRKTPPPRSVKYKGLDQNIQRKDMLLVVCMLFPCSFFCDIG
jgi:hypothetical protein